jgi:hypothetical protein
MRGNTEGVVGPGLADARLPLPRKGQFKPPRILALRVRARALSNPIAQELTIALTRMNKSEVFHAV